MFQAVLKRNVCCTPFVLRCDNSHSLSKFTFLFSPSPLLWSSGDINLTLHYAAPLQNPTRPLAVPVPIDSFAEWRRVFSLLGGQRRLATLEICGFMSEGVFAHPCTRARTARTRKSVVGIGAEKRVDCNGRTKGASDSDCSADSPKFSE